MTLSSPTEKRLGQGLSHLLRIFKKSMLKAGVAEQEASKFAAIILSLT
jgi:hypothetical protein